MNVKVKKIKSTLNKFDVSGNSNKGLFAFDPDLNAWVRVEANLDIERKVNLDHLVITDKEQSDFWFAW